MALNRRQLLMGGLGAAAASMGLTACGGGSSGGGSSDGSAEPAVRLVGQRAAQQEHHGGDRRLHQGQPQGEDLPAARRVRELLGQARHPDRRQQGSGHHPDGHGLHRRVRQARARCWISSKYGADTSKFVDGSVDSGKIDDKLVGINAGINSPTILANPKIFEQAKVEMPDDTTWTWDQMREVGAEVTAKAGNGMFGMAMFFNDAMLSAFLRQNGKELFTARRARVRGRRRRALVRHGSRLREGQGDPVGRAAQRGSRQAAGPERVGHREGRHADATGPIRWRRSTRRPAGR